MTQPERLHYFAIGLSAAAVLWTAALLFVPLQQPQRVSPIVGAAIHAIGSVVCHQRPERSFHGHGGRFPVCARCTGLYVSGAIGALLGWFGVARTPRRVRRNLLLAALPTAGTVAFEWLGYGAVSNLVRASSALPLGALCGWLFIRMLRTESTPSTCAMIA